MISKRPGIKIYRKLRYRKGHGVHSPFMYNLITKVLEEKAPYYIFEDIEKKRTKLLSQKNRISIITRKETQTKNYGALLFRLVNFFKPTTVLQIGSSTGIMSLYLGTASKDCRYFFLEERKGLFQVEEFKQDYLLDHFSLKEGDYEAHLEELRSEISRVDLIHINLHGDVEKTKNIIRLIAPFIHSKTILLIDGIGLNKAMQRYWSDFISHSTVRISWDLFALGIVFFDRKFQKQHYKNYIDHGKKQNLYQTRRRRFHFPRRRKKGSQKQSPD